jgi:putative redox protein
MENIRTSYEGELKTTALHLLSGTVIMTDAPPDNGGKGEFFSPTDLLAASLASCMLTIMGQYAARENFSIDGTKAFVTKIMASEPRRIGAIKIDLYFPHDHYTGKQKIILERTTRLCPVSLSLHPDIKQIVTLHYQTGE